MSHRITISSACVWRAAFVAGALFTSAPASAEKQQQPAPSISDLEFLLGDWDITFEIFDTHNPGSQAIFTEKGHQSCRYDLEFNAAPVFISCKGEVTSDRGRTRSFQESIRYNRFLGAFERIGMYSNWPSHGVEKVYFHPEDRELELRGELTVGDGVVERYEDIYVFSEDFASYTRRNVANFSDMRANEFNLTLTGTGQKRD